MQQSGACDICQKSIPQAEVEVGLCQTCLDNLNYLADSQVVVENVHQQSIEAVPRPKEHANDNDQKIIQPSPMISDRKQQLMKSSASLKQKLSVFQSGKMKSVLKVPKEEENPSEFEYPDLEPQISREDMAEIIRCQNQLIENLSERVEILEGEQNQIGSGGFERVQQLSQRIQQLKIENQEEKRKSKELQGQVKAHSKSALEYKEKNSSIGLQLKQLKEQISTYQNQIKELNTELSQFRKVYDENEGLCKICLAKPSLYCIDECGHICTCEDHQNISVCPICRKEGRNIRVYASVFKV